MQKWQYMEIVQYRGWAIGKDARGKDLPHATATAWSPQIDLGALGNDGWELVSVVPKSDYLGSFHQSHSGEAYAPRSHDFAGFTSSQTWVFKRGM